MNTDMIMGIMYNAMAFYILMTILIGGHEFGHYLAARLMSIKIKEFSIGFGPKLISWKSKKTNISYSFALLPLGGFISMLSDKQLMEMTQEEREKYKGMHAIDIAPKLRRFFVIIAGPFANLLIALGIFTFLCYGSYQFYPAVLGQPTGVAQESGLQSKDIVLKVNNNETESISDLFIETTRVIGEKFSVTIDRNGQEKTYEIDGTSIKLTRNGDSGMEQLGLNPFYIQTNVIKGIDGESNLFKINDIVIDINGSKIENLKDINNELQKESSKNSLEFGLLRDGKKEIVALERANLINHQIKFSADQEVIDFTKTKEQEGFNGVIASTVKGVEKTVLFSGLVFSSFEKLFTGSMDFNTLSGVPGMSKAAGESMSGGYERFLLVIAVLSINLMIINLLPIPPLDGGQAVSVAFENFPKAKQIGKVVTIMGLALILTFMVSVNAIDIYHSLKEI